MQLSGYCLEPDTSGDIKIGDKLPVLGDIRASGLGFRILSLRLFAAMAALWAASASVGSRFAAPVSPPVRSSRPLPRGHLGLRAYRV